MAEVEYESGRQHREEEALRRMKEMTDACQRLADLLEQHGPALHALTKQRRGEGLAAFTHAVRTMADQGAFTTLIEAFTGRAPGPPPSRRRRRRDQY